MPPRLTCPPLLTVLLWYVWCVYGEEPQAIFSVNWGFYTHRIGVSWLEADMALLCGRDFRGERPALSGPAEQLSPLSNFYSKSVLYGAFVWARRAL